MFGLDPWKVQIPDFRFWESNSLLEVWSRVVFLSKLLQFFPQTGGLLGHEGPLGPPGLVPPPAVACASVGSTPPTHQVGKSRIKSPSPPRILKLGFEAGGGGANPPPPPEHSQHPSNPSPMFFIVGGVLPPEPPKHGEEMVFLHLPLGVAGEEGIEVAVV